MLQQCGHTTRDARPHRIQRLAQMLLEKVRRGVAPVE